MYLALSREPPISSLMKMRACYRESGSKVESPNEPKCVSTVIHGRLGLILNEQGNDYFVQDKLRPGQIL